MQYLIWFAAILISLSFHEYAHALAAKANGDNTAEQQGRMTLNPLAHIDLFGTILLPILLLVTSGGRFSFGWAKPVPVDPRNYKDYRKGELQVSSAGIIANLILAGIFSLVLRLMLFQFGFAPNNGLIDFLAILAVINVALAIFNLLPFPPLDGSGILFALLPSSQNTDRLRLFLVQNGFWLLIGFLILDSFIPILGIMISFGLIPLNVICGCSVVSLLL